jgi:isoquinoline 1-oxidoreductase alpha subunit
MGLGKVPLVGRKQASPRGGTQTGGHMIDLTVNGQAYRLDIDPDMPLLWALREAIGLTGTKYACGIAVCGACIVHVDGRPLHSCATSVASVAGKAVTTIEGLDSREGDAIREAWQDANVVQCGYCQPGQILAATALLTQNRNPSDADIDLAMAGNLCRCATYARIRTAIKAAAKKLAQGR